MRAWKLFGSATSKKTGLISAWQSMLCGNFSMIFEPRGILTKACSGTPPGFSSFHGLYVGRLRKKKKIISSLFFSSIKERFWLANTFECTCKICSNMRKLIPTGVSWRKLLYCFFLGSLHFINTFKHTCEHVTVTCELITIFKTNILL